MLISNAGDFGSLQSLYFHALLSYEWNSGTEISQTHTYLKWVFSFTVSVPDCLSSFFVSTEKDYSVNRLLVDDLKIFLVVASIKFIEFGVRYLVLG